MLMSAHIISNDPPPINIKANVTITPIYAENCANTDIALALSTELCNDETTLPLSSYVVSHPPISALNVL